MTMRPFRLMIVLAVAQLVFVTSADAQNSASRSAEVLASTTFAVPGATSTNCDGINSKGQIVGQYDVCSGGPCTFHGFLWDQGNITTIDEPDAVYGTFLAGINSRGQIVGNYFVPSGASTAGHPFLLDGGVFTPIEVPGASMTTVTGINDQGQTIGIYFPNTGGSHGFLLDQGVVTNIDVPGALQTFPQRINNSGEIIGRYNTFSVATGVRQHAFLFRAGTFTTIVAPSPDDSILLWGINDRGQIVGAYGNSSFSQVFLFNNGEFTSIDLHGINSPIPFGGINDSGQIAGSGLFSGGGGGCFVSSR